MMALKLTVEGPGCVRTTAVMVTLGPFEPRKKPVVKKRDPYVMVYEIIPTYLGMISSPTNPLNNHLGPFFRTLI